MKIDTSSLRSLYTERVVDDEAAELVRQLLRIIADGFGVPEETLPLEVQQGVTRAVYTAQRRARRRRRRSEAAIPVATQEDEGS